MTLIDVEKAWDFDGVFSTDNRHCLDSIAAFLVLVRDTMTVCKAVDMLFKREQHTSQ